MKKSEKRLLLYIVGSILMVIMIGNIFFRMCIVDIQNIQICNCNDVVYDTQCSVRIDLDTMLNAESIEDMEQNKQLENKKKKDAALQRELYAKSAVLMDADSGRVLFAKEGKNKLPMASTTKIMTCILALETADLDEMITFSGYAVGMPKVKMYAKSGDSFQLRDLLTAMMLESYNDVAVAIAENIGRNYFLKNDDDVITKEPCSQECVAAFVERMNQKAIEMGCENTHFFTPNGLDTMAGLSADNIEVQEGDGQEQLIHYTTAEDLAKIMRYCVNISPMKEEFLQITRTPSITFKSQHQKNYYATNHNAMLQMYQGTESGKTGYTSKAGYCYVGSALRGERHMIVAILACGWPGNKNYKWLDAKKMYQYGLENYCYIDLEKLDLSKKILSFVQIVYKDDSFSKTPQDLVVGLEDCELLTKGFLLGEEENITLHIIYCSKLDGSIMQNTVVGEVEYEIDGTVIAKQMIKSLQAVEKRRSEKNLWNALRNYIMTC